MSRTEAVEAYRAAHKKALKTYREDAEHGRWPYPQVLDDLLDGTHVAGRIELGVLNVPTDRIVGIVSAGRRTVFSRDFMPLPEPNTEFGAKWTSLCEAHLDDEGIRDPIRCYEYFGSFYVQEGNKRLSVMRFFDAPTIPASVLRIVPAYSDDPETRLYYEFLEFYHLSRTYAFRFTKPGRYQKLVAALGFEPDEIWTKRIALLKDYQVNKELMAMAKPTAIFMHCLPSFHDTTTTIGADIAKKFGITEMEVTDEVFESRQSKVFDEAENRMHTIKAVIYATLC